MNHPSYGFQRSDRLQAGRPFVSDRHTNHSHAAHEYEGRSEFRRPGEARHTAGWIGVVYGVYRGCIGGVQGVCGGCIGGV